MKDTFINGHKTAPPHFLTIVLMAASAAMTMNIFLPSLTAISVEFNTSYSTAQLVLSGYLGVTAVVQLIIGPLSDRFGRRPVILVAYLFFMAGSLICAMAPSMEVLLFGRLVQAASATSMALARAIIRDLFTRSKAASMIGYVTMAMAIGPMIAPILGGFLQDNYSWRASFLFLFIISTLMLIVCWYDLGETNKNKSTSLKTQFQNYFRLMREKTLWIYILVTASTTGVFFSFLGGADYVGRNFLNLTPTCIGIYFVFVSLGYMGGNYISGRYTEKTGIESMMIVGTAITVVGVLVALALYGLMAFHHAAALFAPMFLVGVGNGIALPSANTGAISVRPDLAGSASGLTGFMQIGGGAALSYIAANMLGPETGPYPMLYIMLASAVVSMIAAWIIHIGPRSIDDE
jgi:DHA1 family bicyclomycin/chloramphenicol resistance-like MFS transporter